MLQIAICDDEPFQLALLGAFVSEWAKENRREISLELCRNAEQFLFLMEELAEKRQSVDILLLDIEMPRMDGMALAHRLRENGAGMQFLFVTGIAERAPEGYDVDAVSFLIKPVKKERLSACLDKAASRIGRREPAVLLETAMNALEELTHSPELKKIRTPETCKGSRRIFRSK